MLSDLTFRDVCKLLRGEDGKLLEAADRFLALGIIFTPVIVGPQAMPVLALLKVKDELVILGRELLHTIKEGKKSGYLGRAERMQAAYGLICFTAFFDAIDQLLPRDLRKNIDLLPQDKARLAEQQSKSLDGKHKEEVDACHTEGLGIPDTFLPFPHPVFTFEEQTAHLEPMYKSMANGFGEFIKKLAVWEQADEKGKAQLRTVVENLPNTALQCFVGQYIELARTYPDFCIWSRLLEQNATQAKVEEVSEYVREYARLSAESEKKIDVGFSELQNAVQALPDHFQQVQARAVVEALKRYYDGRISEPIIEDEYETEEGKPALTFPRISEAFVPQAYQVLRQTTKDRHLEREETWKDLDAKHDLHAFLLSYLSSPYSIETPLLILGHPGSGKSLLTKVLSARLMSESYTPIRVQLRDVDVDSPIESQIEGEITRVTGSQIGTWAGFSSQFAERPLVVLLDGYDELLQASGQVFAGYLKGVQKFQEREVEQNRPVRVIVTSRVALIDKATVPTGSTVVRLLEFDERRRNEWIRIWNIANSGYFRSCSPPIEPFELPKDGHDGKEDKILALAGQPLLLLMLAIFDSEDNNLRKHRTLDRTVLYDRLLRRFVERERRRYVLDFESLPKDDKDKILDEEMRRLGVAAIGMYNRSKFHIRISDLDWDIGYFSVARDIPVERGRRPAQESDLLLSSFFFIHKSKAGEKGAGDERKEGDTAFEFLHNTFGEFLTADFILRVVFQETATVHRYKADKDWHGELQRKLFEPDALVREWFACLIHAALYSRPVVLEMMREWCGHLLQKKCLSPADFLASLGDIVGSQVGMILRARNLPPMLSSNDNAHFADLPMLAHVAIYTLNLVTLRAVLDTAEFVFDEDIYRSPGEKGDSDESGTRPWDMLAYLWRSWFSLDNLNGLTAVLSGRRDGSKVTLTARKTFQVSPSADHLETVLNVASALADHTTAGLAALLSSGSGTNEVACLVQAKERLESESIHLDFEFLVRQLWLSLSSSEMDTENVSQLVMTGLVQCFDGRHRAELVVEFLHLVVDLVKRRRVSFRCERDIRHQFLGGRDMHPGRFIEMRPEIMLEWLRLLRELGGWLWTDGFRHKSGLFEELFHMKMRPKRLTEMMEMRPDLAVEWLRLGREFGGERWMERLGKEEFFEGFFHGPMQPEHLMETMEMRPDVAVDWLRLMREFGGGPWMERFGKEKFFEEFFRGKMHSEHLIETMEMRPDVAIEWFRLMREFGGGPWMERFGKEEFFEEFFRGKMHSEHLMETMEMRPDLAIEWFRLAREFGGEPWMERFGKEGFFEDLFHGAVGPERFIQMIEMRPEVALGWIRLAREVGNTHWIERFGKESGDSGVRLNVGKLPLEYLGDIRWFAEMTHNDALMKEIQSLVG